METFEKIANLLRDRGLKSADLSRATGMSSARLTQLAQGEGKVRSFELLRIARALDVTLEFLVGPAITEPESSLTDAERACLAAIRQLGPAEALRRLLQVGPHVIKPDPAAPKSETPPLPARHDRERRGAG